MVRHPAVVVSSFIIGFFMLGLPFLGATDAPVALLMLGRLHPLILHFPIVLIMLALLLELASRFKLVGEVGGLHIVLLVTSAVSAFVAIVAGYFLFIGGEYSGELMDQHFWGAVVTGTAIFFALGLYLLSKKRQKLYPYYMAMLVLANLSVGFTGHLGGSITHGTDYLTEYMPLLFQEDDQEPRDESEMLVYDDMIMPIFQAKCLSCHNDSRAKGNLVMTSLQSITNGGDSGLSLLTASAPDESELLNRVTLPADHDDKMPPEGTSPMTDGEIELLRQWIAEGASPGLKVASFRQSPEAATLVSDLLPQLLRYRRQKEIASLKVKELEKELAIVAEKLNVIIEGDPLEPGLFTIRMKFPPAPFTNDQFRELAPYNDVFSRLTLVSSDISDDGLYHIAQMSNVKRLFLQKTTIDGSGFVYLMKMPNLEVLNLSFSQVSDRAAIDLLKFPALREVYLFGSQTSPQVVEALRKNKPELRIIMEEGPYF